jgi:hypothetical protein
MRNAEERRVQLIEEIQETKRQKIDFEVSLRGLLEKHIRMLDLNTVAIEQQDADARLLEEPLPFIQSSDRNREETASQPSDHSDQPVEDAVFAESEQVEPDMDETLDPCHEPKAPELSFDFDPDEVNGEEDLLK